ncbi:MAG: hypothetical protein FJ267_15220 [Planctomycetes bacterium]|nr:hypothetical protein [Planctomycetota bacterium]
MEFNAPHCIVLDGQGRLVVCDRDNSRIQILSQEGKLLETWTGFTPMAAVLDRQGRVFVSDAKRQQVIQLDAKGKELKAWGKEGTGQLEFKTPHMLTIDESGNLYAAEVGGRRIHKLKRLQ